MTTPSRSTFIQCAVLVAVAAGVYLNTLANGLVVDDVHQIVENEWITGTDHLQTIFTQGVWDFEGRTSSYYRPLMYVLYMAVYAVAGLAPWAYHLLNVLFHAAATLLVVMLARQVFPRAEGSQPWFLAPPLVAGLFFAVHPIHTEPVAWAAGIADLGLAVFGLLALWLHAVAVRRGWPADAGAAVAWLLALLCKETAVVVPIIVVAYDVTFVERGRRGERLARGLGLFVPAALLYLGLRVHALGGLMPTATDAGLGLGVSTYARAVLSLLAGYIEKLVLPIGLNFWHEFTPPASLLSAEGVRVIVVVGLAAAASVAVFRNRPARFAVALLFVPLLPTFHLGALNQGLANAFAERYLYLPSAGFVLLAAAAVDALRDRGRVRPATLATGVVILAAACATATVARNRVWKDPLSLWTDAVRKAPASAVAHMNYGSALIYARRSAEGVSEMRKAAAMDPALVDRELAKAAAYLGKGLHKKAILALHTALALDPACAPAHYNLGLVYEARGQIDAAAAAYANALAVNPAYAEAHNNLAILYAERGEMDKALGHFEEAVRLRPGDREFAANLERARRR